MKSSVSNFGFILLSFLFLLLAFPKYDLWQFAWIGLVPWMVVLDGKRPAAAFGWGYLLGVLFFAGTLYWLIHVTLPGMVLLVLYLALYFGFFAVGYAAFARHSIMEKLLLLPSLWVALEFIRGHFLSGFGWSAIGYSQYKNLAMIQIADVTGAAGVSFFVVMVNVLFKEALRVVKDKSGEKQLFTGSIVVLGILGVVLSYGSLRLKENLPVDSTMRVAVVQGNVPQELKWDMSYRLSILEKYMRLTEEATVQKPDIIIWPETSFPGYLWETPQLFETLKTFVSELGIPLLVGVVRSVGEEYFNSAFLISSDGVTSGIYDKLHLVPFGEYVPLRSVFPFLEDIVPVGDFSSGEEYTVFYPEPGISSPENPFSVLICFEDTVAEIARGFVLHGAKLLVNITNDAWFKDTNEPFMHWQGSVFRAIENRRGVVRAANTGISGFIDSRGYDYAVLRDSRGKSTYVEGFQVATAELRSTKTFYTKFGDIFTYLCFGCILGGTLRKRFLSFKNNNIIRNS